MPHRARLVLAVAGLSLVLRAAPAVAADDASGRLGLSLKLSGSDEIGLQVCPTSALCLRPALSYTWVKADNVPSLAELTTDYPVYQTTERYIGAGMDVLWRLRRPGPLVPYLGLGLDLLRADVPYPDLEGTEVVVRNGALHRRSFSASAGFEYSVHRRLSLCGEAGVGVTRSERFGLGGKRLKTTAWGTVSSAVGVIFYLK